VLEGIIFSVFVVSIPLTECVLRSNLSVNKLVTFTVVLRALSQPCSSVLYDFV
jgi:hypothetical protein